MSLNAFRRTLNRSQSTKPPTGRGPSRQPWALKQFSMDIGEPPAKLRVIAPGPDGFFCSNSHFVGRNRRCTQDIFGGKCVYCHEQARAKDKQTARDLNKRFKYTLEVIDFRYHHIVEEEVKGAMRNVLKRCASDDVDPKFKRGRGCKYCSSSKASEAERHGPARKRWELSSKGFETVSNLNRELAGHATADGEVYDAYTVGFECAECSDQCDIELEGEPVPFDEKALAKIEPDDVEAWANREYKCACGFTALPKETWIAVNGDDEEIPGAERLGIFEKSIRVDVNGEKGRDGKQYRTYHTSDNKDFDICPIDVELEDYVNQDEIETLMRPISFENIYRPVWDIKQEDHVNQEEYIQSVLDAQAEVLKIENPYKPDGSPKGSTFGGFRTRR